MANEYKCDICGKPATVHITKIIDSKKVKIHLCSECAEKASLDAIDIPAKIMPKIKEFEQQLIDGVSKAAKVGVCPNCGTSFSEVEKGERFGCPECYDAFAEKLPEFLTQMQYGTLHVGKTPKTHADSSTLNPLDLLGKAIEKVGQLFASADVPPPALKIKVDAVQQPSDSQQPSNAPQKSGAPEKAEDDCETVDALRAKLDEAVKEERYEDAAKLRDRINSLEK